MKTVFVVYSIDYNKYVDLVQAYSNYLKALNECDRLNNSVTDEEQGVVYKVENVDIED